MKKLSTILLRIALIGIALGIAALCFILLPLLWNEIPQSYPAYTFSVYAVFVALFIAAVPFFIGVYKAWQLLNLIDKGDAFSRASAAVVRTIAWCAAVISGIYIVTLPFFYIWADNDDAPGLMLIGLLLASVSFIVAVFAALLQRLISEAADLKSENELTV